MSLSNAVGLERVSKTVGYKLQKGDFSESSPNLPQRIAILGEANKANQGSFDVDLPVQVTSAKEAGDLFGYGSPIHSMVRILKPSNGVGVGSIPIIVYAQAAKEGATPDIKRIAPTGTATKNVTHSVVIAGRSNIDGGSYSFVVEKDDTDAEISVKIQNVINNVLSSPVAAATITDVTEKVDCTSKWDGTTSSDISISIDTNGDSAGITYAVTSESVGNGIPQVVNGLAAFGNEWNTIVLNGYGGSVWDEFEAANGVPDPTNPTGRYEGIIFKPFIALTGSTTENTLATYEATFSTSTRKDQVTNVICPAPNSAAMPYEAAANYGYLFALTSANSPHLDISGSSLPDMPVPADGNIGDMKVYDNRDLFVKAGISTCILSNNRYEINDFVTTYRPDGETPPQFRYARNLMIDFNVRFGYYLLEKTNVVDHAILESNQPSNVSKTIKPKQWIQLLNGYADSLSLRALIVDATFMKDSLEVQTSDTNPDRIETFFRYKRSPYARISSTTAEAGFAFGLN